MEGPSTSRPSGMQDLSAAQQQTAQEHELQLAQLNIIRNESSEALNSWNDAVRSIAQLQDEGRVNLFVGIGIILFGAIVLSLTLLRGGTFTSIEFVTGCGIGTLLIIIGALLQNSSYKSVANVSTTLMETTQSVYKDTIKTRTEAIVGLARNRPAGKPTIGGSE